MPSRWCGRCRSDQAIDWTADVAFGLGAESARCPACGAVWGVRARRKPPVSRRPASHQGQTRRVMGPFGLLRWS